MNYYESAEKTYITHARAIAELRKHGMCDAGTIADFHEACGRCETYEAQQVLRFLGY